MDKKQKHLQDRVLVYAVIWCLSYAGSLFALKRLNVPAAAGILLTAITVTAFALFVYKYYRSIFFMDEVQVKIQMEAVVIAFALSLLLLMTLGLLDLVVLLDYNDWSFRHLLPVFIGFYFTGLFISKRKYNFEDEQHN